MGGSRPKNKANQKVQSKPAELVAAGGGSAVGSANNGTQRCILSFETSFEVVNPVSVAVGDQLFIVPTAALSKLDVYTDSSRLTTYNGPYAELLWQCANDGFEYVGQVVGVNISGDTTKIDCKVETRRRE